MLDHKFATPERNGKTFKTKYKSDLKPTHYIHEQDIKAIQKRFIEVFVRQRPQLPPGALPSCGQFKRDHLILGLYFQVIRTLFKYKKEDCNSDYIFLYCLSGLSKNIDKLKFELQSTAKGLLVNLFKRYQLTLDQINSCLPNNNVPEDLNPIFTLDFLKPF